MPFFSWSRERRLLAVATVALTLLLVLLSPRGVKEWRRCQHCRTYQAYLDEAEALVNTAQAELLNLNDSVREQIDSREFDSKASSSTFRRFYASCQARRRELRERYGLPPDKEGDEDERWVEGLTPWD
jgi:hypothetical protein